MEMILINSSLHDIGLINVDIDIEVGTSEATNDFEITCPPISGTYGFYIPGTEYGGIFERKKTKSNAIEETMKGWTWRGLLTQEIILPPSGSDYRIVTGDANTVIAEILQNVLGGFFSVPETVSGCTITSYQFPLYVNVLDGIQNMLETYGYRLSIHADKPAAGAAMAVTVEAVEAEEISGLENEDSPYIITITENKMGINHLVCMGRGELQNRQKVDLYVDQNGQIGLIRYYTGFMERTAYYDYSSAESLEELSKHGKKRLKELSSSISVEITVTDNYDAEIGDIVTASVAGNVVQTPIIKKTVKITGGVISTSLKTREVQ